MKLVSAGQMRSLETTVFATGITPESLMQTAGKAAAYAIRDRLGDARARRVVVLAGPGNNGGDGLVAARHLYELGADVRVYLLAQRPEGDPNLQALRQAGIDAVELVIGGPLADLAADIGRADAIVDALLGIGRQRPIEGLMAEALDVVNERRGLLFAIDTPSGVDPDTGAVGAQAVRADVTLTFGYSKLGLHLLPGTTYAGEVQVLDIGLPEDLGKSIDTEVMTPSLVRALLPERPLVSNKGTYGRVMVVAGSRNFSGAATLCCLGALRSGAGLVTLAATESARASVAAQVPEVTHLPLPDNEGEPGPGAGDTVAGSLDGYDVLVIGPGMGQSPGAQALVRGLLSSEALAALPAVIDADALNTLARWPRWEDHITPRSVLTPHPGELGRLSRATPAEVQARRLDSARENATAWRQTLVLKGAETVVADPEQGVRISPFANAALATAGTGDVLAGTIGGLLAQGLAPFDAASLGVWLHAKAADLFAEQYGPSGLLASEVAAGIARAANLLRRGE